MNFGVSNLFFELALVFLPGFIWMKIHANYGRGGDRTQFDLVLNAFIFGAISYSILALIYRMVGAELRIFSIDSDSKKLLQPDILPDIFYAVLVAIVCGTLNLYVDNYKIFTRFVQSIRATKTYGDEDVWDFVFNSPTRETNFVFVRDFEQRVVYSGAVRVFSESGQLRELLLVEVEAYDFDGNKMYEIPSLYLARERENIHIEFPLAG